MWQHYKEIRAYLPFVNVEKLVERDFATNWVLIGLICWLLIVGKNVYTLAAWHDPLMGWGRGGVTSCWRSCMG